MSFTNILEGARQYFQGLPSTNNNRDGSTPTNNQQQQQQPTTNQQPQQIQPPQQTTNTPQPQYFPPPQTSSAQSTIPTNNSDLRWTDSSKSPFTPPYTQYNNIIQQNSTSTTSKLSSSYPTSNNLLFNSSHISPKTNFNHYNNHNNSTPPSSNSIKNTMVNNIQYKTSTSTSSSPSVHQQYMFNSSTRLAAPGVFEGTNHSSSKSTISQVPSQHRNSAINHQQSSSTSTNLLNLDRQQQQYNNSRNNLVNSRPIPPSSTHQQYPTISTMDRAFAQQYAKQQQLSTRPSNNVDLQQQQQQQQQQHLNNYHHSRQQISTTSPYTIPQHYSTSTKTSSTKNQQQQQQPQPYSQQLRQHLINTSSTQQVPTSTKVSSQTKLHHYASSSSTSSTQYQQQQQYQQTQSTSNYPTMGNPAAWFSQMTQQQFRSPSSQHQVYQQQQQQQQSQQRSNLNQGTSSSTTSSLDLLAKAASARHSLQTMANADLNLMKTHSTTTSTSTSTISLPQHELGAHLLQPPKVPPPQRQRSGPRRDSPLDLSVRTIRRSADSTLDDEGPLLIRTPELARTPTQYPDSSAPTPPRLIPTGPTEQARQEISLPNLLRSSEPMLPSFRPSFRVSGEMEKPRESSLLSLEQKFGPRVSAPAETLTQPLLPPTYPPQPQHREQQQSHSQLQYHSHREQAMPHLAAHALAHNMQYQRHPKPNNAAADKRVLSILRNSLEVRNAQQQKLLAASEGMSSTYRLQVPRAMDSASPQFLREARQQSEASRPPQPPVMPPNMQPPPQGHPQGPDFDGLAAFLAARIRTKAELKQCGDTSLMTTSTSNQKPRQRTVECTCQGACTCSTRPKCRCEGTCTCGQQRAAPVSARKASDTRSSTETSVFDFPDSDPEMSAPASVGDLRRNRKPPSTDTPVVCTDGQHCPPSTATQSTPPAPVTAAVVTTKVEVDEDPLWASICDNFVTSLETRGAKTSRAGHNFVAQKRKFEEAENGGSKIRKTEIEIDEDDEEEEEEEIPQQQPIEQKISTENIKQEPVEVPVCKEEIALIQTCLKATSECEKLLEIIPPSAKLKIESDSDDSVVKKNLNKKKVVESSSSSESESDSEESVNLAVRQQHLLALVSSSESTESSSDDSDWSDDVGRAVVGRLQPKNTRTRGRGYNIRTRLRSNQTPKPGPKRPGRPRRIIKSPSPDDDDDDESSRDKSESPKPPVTRRTRQRSPSPMVRRTRRMSKSPVISNIRNKKSKSPIPSKNTRSKSPTPSKYTRNKSKSPTPCKNTRTKSKSPTPSKNTRNKSKSPTPSKNTRNKSKSPTPSKNTRNKSKSPTPSKNTRNKSKSPTPSKNTRNKSKSPIRSKSPITRNSRKRSKTPENKRQSPNSKNNKSKSPSPTLHKTSTDRKDSPSSTDQGFYPGWESELIKFKKSLRMPSNLISIHSRPNSDPPTPTKKRRGVTNSPVSLASDPGISRTLAVKKFLRDLDTSDSSNSTPQHKPKIRDVELSDSSCSLPGRPRRNVATSKTLQDRTELLTKLANKLKNRVAGQRGRKKKTESSSEDRIVKDDSDDDKNKVVPRRGLRKRRRSSRLSGTMERRLLRSAALQRSNRALLNSKRHLRIRDLKACDILKVVVPAKPGAKRGPKGRRKMRSSGFDYLRKKKKKKDAPEGKRVHQQATRVIASSIEEIANEVRVWVVNKGLGETILHRAARICHNDMVAYCLECLDMDPSPRDNAGYTPLHEACVRGHLSTARLLLRYGAKVDSSAQGGIRPLHEAADCGNIELLRLLLSYGADPLLATYCGQTPLELAATPETRQLLEQHLADIQGRTAPLWKVKPNWNMDTEERSHYIGFDVLDDVPSPNPESEDEYDFEEITIPQPPVNGLSRNSTFPASWWIPNETESYMLLPEVCANIGHTPDWIRKTLRGEMVTIEMAKTQFLESVHCVHLLAADWKPDTVKFNSCSNLTLVKYDENIKRLLINASSKIKAPR